MLRVRVGLLAGLSCLLLGAWIAGCASDGEVTDAGATGSSTSGGTTGGSSTGGTTGGSSGGDAGHDLAPGSPCVGGGQCASGVCGTDGSGNCCAASCDTSDTTCGATSCDGRGACLYPSATTHCGVDSCTGNDLTQSSCDGAGACVPLTTACASHLKCADATGCAAQCSLVTDCTTGFYCSGNSCVAQLAVGACSSNDACASGICGVNGTGHCCSAACDTSDPTCGALDCDGTGVCSFPIPQTPCGAPSSCTGSTETLAASCNGAGACRAGEAIDCAPYVCGPTNCLTTCTTSADCLAGSFCDAQNGTCCSGLAGGGTLVVDGTSGSDATLCCGIGGNGACQTLSHAMALIDAAQAQNVTLAATVNGGGGDWTATESYPVTLGWGVELNAPGVFFLDPPGLMNQFHAAIFDVNFYSANDTVGYASIVGSAESPIGVGMDSASSQQTGDTAAIAVENQNTLYLANASVNGSWNNSGSEEAILVTFGATLSLGQDQSGGVSGTVTVGSAVGTQATGSTRGIVCTTDQVGLGCTIQDAPLVGTSSLVIQGQRYGSIIAEDFASISLTSHPIFGVSPAAMGFNQCPHKDLASAVALFGPSKLTLSNGTIQCLAGGIGVGRSSYGNANPVASIDNTVIQNTEIELGGSAGTLTVTNSTLRYNVIGVYQTQDEFVLTDLSGGGNTIICNSTVETADNWPYPGVGVWNLSSSPIDARNVAWNTGSPDYFTCDASFVPCTCNLSSCTGTAGADDMDAVDDAYFVGGITITGGTHSPDGCN